jgi:hypothetical protein
VDPAPKRAPRRRATKVERSPLAEATERVRAAVEAAGRDDPDAA